MRALMTRTAHTRLAIKAAESTFCLCNVCLQGFIKWLKGKMSSSTLITVSTTGRGQVALFQPGSTPELSQVMA
jgi:hypothetical protein